MPFLDPPLTPPPKIKLSRLRDIGWTSWDPIGLLGSEQSWNDEDCISFTDEYDSYLMQAASQLRRGMLDANVASYLVQIEAEHVGLGNGQGALDRASQVVAAMQSDDELWTIPC